MRVLIAYDGSAYADAAVDDLALAGLGAKGEAVVIAAVEVSPPLDGTASCLLDRIALTCLSESWRTPEALAAAKAVAEAGAEKTRQKLPAWNVEARWRLGNAVATIEHEALECSPDLVVVGGHHRHALGRIFAGGTSCDLASRLTCSVRVARRGAMGTSSGIKLMIVDTRSGGDPHLCDVVVNRQWPTGSHFRLIGDSQSHASLQCATDEVTRHGYEANLMLLDGVSARVVVHAAQAWQADSILLSGNDETGLNLSGLAREVVLHAPCTVEVVRGDPSISPTRAVAASTTSPTSGAS